MERMEGAWKGWRESVERMEEECGKDGGRVWKGWRVRGKDGGRVWKGWRESVERMEGAWEGWREGVERMEGAWDGWRVWKGWRVHGRDGWRVHGRVHGRVWKGWREGVGGMEGGCGKDGDMGGDLCCSFILKACLHIYINVPQDKAYMCVCCV